MHCKTLTQEQTDYLIPFMKRLIAIVEGRLVAFLPFTSSVIDNEIPALEALLQIAFNASEAQIIMDVELPVNFDEDTAHEGHEQVASS